MLHSLQLEALESIPAGQRSVEVDTENSLQDYKSERLEYTSLNYLD